MGVTKSGFSRIDVDVILGNCTKLLVVDLPGIKTFRWGQRLYGI